MKIRRTKKTLQALLHAGTRGQRTENMNFMSVTRDVSRLSGWLKADADPNMRNMLVTLDVSRVSGWLKAAAE